MSVEAVEQPVRPKVLLAGEASARPAGLERALTRAGFQLVEREEVVSEPHADAVLITLTQLNGEPLPDPIPAGRESALPPPPRIVLLSTPDPEGTVDALIQGAADALAAPIHLPELCARLHARIREAKDGRQQNGAGQGDAAIAAGAEETLDRRVQEEFERARRYSLSFSLVLLGVDELAGLSERAGAAAADNRRREFGGILRQELRLPDFVVPYGVDEFAIVLPETDQIGARQSVTRIRERLTAIASDGDPRDERPRVSAGIVTYPHPAAAQTEDLFDLAEAALERGKAQSGERIGIAM